MPNIEHFACAEHSPEGYVCRREPGHPGVHEGYAPGKRDEWHSWFNDRGWRVTRDADEDGDYWQLRSGSVCDDEKYDSQSSADAACEIANRRGLPARAPCPVPRAPCPEKRLT